MVPASLTCSGLLEKHQSVAQEAYITFLLIVQEPTARGLFQQIVLGLTYLEHKGVENHGGHLPP